LQHLAALLSNTARSGDFVFRFGGEEFIIVSVEMPALQALHEAEKIRKAVENDPVLLPEGRQLHMTVSIGVATYDGHPDYQHLIEQADQALYAAKSEGRNRVVPSQRPQPT
jgi:diguanylate cyclase